MGQKRATVMGIININDDSFYAKSRVSKIDDVVERALQMFKDGADMIDFGACSTRPGAKLIPPQEEIDRLIPPLLALKERMEDSDSQSLRNIISVDTFRSEVVNTVYETIGEFTVNDISAGEDDDAMLPLVSELFLPYIAMHKRGIPETMQNQTDYPNGVENEVYRYFEEFALKAEKYSLRNWILDPGFGFAKTIEQNYSLLKNLSIFKDFNVPILVGVSRKSMIYKLLSITPEEALEGTDILNFFALQNGANILRVHDVKSAKMCLELYNAIYRIES